VRHALLTLAIFPWLSAPAPLVIAARSFTKWQQRTATIAQMLTRGPPIYNHLRPTSVI
jgi:hypothetical protein